MHKQPDARWIGRGLMVGSGLGVVVGSVLSALTQGTGVWVVVSIPMGVFVGLVMGVWLSVNFAFELPGQCPHCDYDARGLRTPVCPECGKDVRHAQTVTRRFDRKWLALCVGVSTAVGLLIAFFMSSLLVIAMPSMWTDFYAILVMGLLLGGGAGAFFGILIPIMNSQPPTDRCPNCDYPTEGLRSGTCPECGEELPKLPTLPTRRPHRNGDDHAMDEPPADDR